MIEQWEKDLEMSEWLVRIIIDGQNGLNIKKLQNRLTTLLNAIIPLNTRLNKHFYFTLGASMKLVDWLESEVAVGNLLACGNDENRTYQVSPFMKNLTEVNKLRIYGQIKKVLL